MTFSWPYVPAYLYQGVVLDRPEDMIDPYDTRAYPFIIGSFVDFMNA